MDEVDVMDFRKVFVAVGLVLGLSGPGLAQGPGWAGWVTAILPDSGAVAGLTMDSLLAGVADGHILKRSGDDVVGVAHAGSSSNTQVLFNDGGVPAGNSSVTYDKTLNRFHVAQIYSSAYFSVNGGFAMESISSGSDVILPAGGAGIGGITLNSHPSGTERRIRFQYNNTTVGRFDPLKTPEPNFWINYNLSIKSDSSSSDVHVGDVPGSFMNAGDLGFTAHSDSTLKRNRQPIQSVIPDAQILSRLQGVRVEQWQWDPARIIEPFHPSKVAGWDTLTATERQRARQDFELAAARRAAKLAQKVKYGPMAQEFNAVFGDPNNVRISQDRINAVLLQAVQELTRRVNVLQARVAQLEQGR